MGEKISLVAGNKGRTPRLLGFAVVAAGFAVDDAVAAAGFAFVVAKAVAAAAAATAAANADAVLGALMAEILPVEETCCGRERGENPAIMPDPKEGI